MLVIVKWGLRGSAPAFHCLLGTSTRQIVRCEIVAANIYFSASDTHIMMFSPHDKLRLGQDLTQLCHQLSKKSTKVRGLSVQLVE
jgi:hypothetical protein